MTRPRRFAVASTAAALLFGGASLALTPAASAGSNNTERVAPEAGWQRSERAGAHGISVVTFRKGDKTITVAGRQVKELVPVLKYSPTNDSRSGQAELAVEPSAQGASSGKGAASPDAPDQLIASVEAVGGMDEAAAREWAKDLIVDDAAGLSPAGTASGQTSALTRTVSSTTVRPRAASLESSTPFDSWCASINITETYMYGCMYASTDYANGSDWWMVEKMKSSFHTNGSFRLPRHYNMWATHGSYNSVVDWSPDHDTPDAGSGCRTENTSVVSAKTGVTYSQSATICQAHLSNYGPYSPATFGTLWIGNFFEVWPEKNYSSIGNDFIHSPPSACYAKSCIGWHLHAEWDG